MLEQRVPAPRGGDACGSRALGAGQAATRAPPIRSANPRNPAHRNQFNAHVRLESPTRAADIAEDEFVRLYPLVLYPAYRTSTLIDDLRSKLARVGGLERFDRSLIPRLEWLAEPVEGEPDRSPASPDARGSRPEPGAT